MLRNGPWQVFLIGALALLMGGILSPGLGPALQAQQNYTRDANWPQYPSDMTFEMGTGNAVSADGVIYTVSRDIHQRGAVVRAGRGPENRTTSG